DAPGQDAETVLADAQSAMRDFTFVDRGALSVIATPNEPYYPAFPGTLVSVRAALRVAASALSRADILKNGVSIFTDPAHRPAIAAGDLTNLASGIDISDFVVGDYFQRIWPDVGAGAVDGSITLGMCVKPGCYPL